MSRNHFVIDTKAYCLLCLKSSPARDKLSELGIVGEGSATPKVFSLQRVCHYLKLNMRMIFQDVIAVTPTSLPVLEKTELKGVLCEECSELTETFSEITLELEVLQMMLDSCVRKLHDKVEVIHSNAELTEKFKRDMLNSPQTLLHYGIVEQLRKETLKKSSLLIEKAQPRVTLSRLDIPNQVPTLEAPSKPPSESSPVISSVQGHYYTDGNNYPSRSNINLSSEHIMSMELTAGNISPRPGSPTFTKMEIGTVTEEPRADPLSSLIGFSTRTGSSTLPYLQHVTPPPPVSISTIHQGITSRDQGRNYKCRLCPVTFLSQSNMHRHIKQFHNNGGNKQSGATKPSKPPSWSPTPAETVHFQIGNIERIELNEGTDRDPLSDFLPEDEPEQGLQSQVNSEGEVEVDSNLKCQYCSKRCSTVPILRRHLTVVHRKFTKEKYKCELCGKKFSQSSSLSTHKKGVHFGERHSCPLCFGMFTQKASVTSHMKYTCPKRNR